MDGAHRVANDINPKQIQWSDHRQVMCCGDPTERPNICCSCFVVVKHKQSKLIFHFSALLWKFPELFLNGDDKHLINAKQVCLPHSNNVSHSNRHEWLHVFNNKSTLTFILKYCNNKKKNRSVISIEIVPLYDWESILHEHFLLTVSMRYVGCCKQFST